MLDGGLVQMSMEANIESVDIEVDTTKAMPLKQPLHEERGCEIDIEYDRVNKEGTEDPVKEEKYFCGNGESEDGETEVNDVVQDTELEIKNQNKNEAENDERTEEGNQEQIKDGEESPEKKLEFKDQTIKDVNAKINREEESHVKEGIKTETTRETDTEEALDRESQQDNTNAMQVAPVLAEPKPRDRLSPQDAQKQIRRLTPDFPDSLYELLCSLQEGRRLNDQRCSFTMERRCQSEPSTPVPRHRVVFSSMTSLQKEEFFEFVATSQGRRLNDQRAELQEIPAPQPPLQPKARKASLKGAEARRAAPKPAPKEELYNMILSSQAQGRLEEQRSPAPGPMDDEDFFSLLLRVQGGRIDEQRTELPITLRD